VVGERINAGSRRVSEGRTRRPRGGVVSAASASRARWPRARLGVGVGDGTCGVGTVCRCRARVRVPGKAAQRRATGRRCGGRAGVAPDFRRWMGGVTDGAPRYLLTRGRLGGFRAREGRRMFLWLALVN
jgi:hypothetical protein